MIQTAKHHHVSILMLQQFSSKDSFISAKFKCCCSVRTAVTIRRKDLVLAECLPLIHTALFRKYEVIFRTACNHNEQKYQLNEKGMVAAREREG